jgi:hypothetical protein
MYGPARFRKVEEARDEEVAEADAGSEGVGNFPVRLRGQPGREPAGDDDRHSRYGAGEYMTQPAGDGVSAWRGTKMLWRRELPPDAELRVSGDRIFAVTKTSSRVLFKEITPPAATRPSRRH